MDLISVTNGSLQNEILKSRFTPTDKPSRAEAEQAVRCLIMWAGDDPDREGLLDTPKRVVKSYSELFSGFVELQELMFEHITSLRSSC